MTRSLTVRPLVRRDLRGIWLYTAKTWSREQADNYVAKLNAAMQGLRERPELGRSCDDISPGLFKRRAERHVIYFRWSEQIILIVRVLHDRMSPDAHLANDNP